MIKYQRENKSVVYEKSKAVNLFEAYFQKQTPILATPKLSERVTYFHAKGASVNNFKEGFGHVSVSVFVVHSSARRRGFISYNS